MTRSVSIDTPRRRPRRPRHRAPVGSRSGRRCRVSALASRLQHVDAAELVGERAGKVGRAVGAVVVDHQHRRCRDPAQGTQEPLVCLRRSQVGRTIRRRAQRAETLTASPLVFDDGGAPRHDITRAPRHPTSACASSRAQRSLGASPDVRSSERRSATAVPESSGSTSTPGPPATTPLRWPRMSGGDAASPGRGLGEAQLPSLGAQRCHSPPNTHGGTRRPGRVVRSRPALGGSSLVFLILLLQLL